MSEALINISEGVIRKGNTTVLSAITLTIDKEQHWVITGASGSGKTTLLSVMAGNSALTQGRIHYNFTTPGADSLTAHKPIALVTLKHSFRDAFNMTSFYYQQRYNSADAENSTTVAGYMLAAVQPGTENYWTTERVTTKFHLEPLLNKHLIKLSNGETRRLMMAAALLKNPEVLLLDNPLTGLDAGTREQFNGLFEEIAASGITLILTVSAGEILPIITHVAALANGCLTYAGGKQQYAEQANSSTYAALKSKDQISKLFAAGNVCANYSHIVSMKQVNVTYGTTPILRNINWTILPGERWALLGPNGAGKSTLLSLINGDNPQAYANDITLFDQKRGSGESIWDLKKKIGFISPELYQYFPSDQSCLQVVESGYYDTLGLFRASHQAKATTALEWMKALQIDQYARKLFKTIPAGAQRLCLLARALIKCPPLLILDEPRQGLDDEQQQNFKQIIDLICASSNVSLIYVTHYLHEIPDSVQHTLQLNKGEVAAIS